MITDRGVGSALSLSLPGGMGDEFAFEEEGVLPWVDAQLARATGGAAGGGGAAPLLTADAERALSAVDVRLQASLWEANAEIDTSMQCVLRAVPALAQEMRTVLRENDELSRSLDEISEHIAAVISTTEEQKSRLPGDGGDGGDLGDQGDARKTVQDHNVSDYSEDPLQKLLRLETTRSNIKATSEKLSNHALWNKTVRSVRKRLRHADLLPAANMLHQLREISAALEQLQGKEARAETLRALHGELDKMIGPSFQSALDSNNMRKLAEFAEIFSIADDRAAFEHAYVHARCKSLHERWTSNWNKSLDGGELKQVEGFRAKSGTTSNDQEADRSSELLSAYRLWLRSCFDMVNVTLSEELRHNLPELLVLNTARLVF